MVAGVAGELHAVFGGAERGGADAFAGRQQRPGQRAGVDALADRLAEPAAHVAEVARPRGRRRIRRRRRRTSCRRSGRGRRSDRSDRAARAACGSGRSRERGDQRVGHVSGDLVELLRRSSDVALAPVEAGLRGVMLPGGIEPDDAAVVVDHLQPAADMDRRGRDHVALLDQRELGGAAADVDVEDALALVVTTPARRPSRRPPASTPCDGRRWRRRNRRPARPAVRRWPAAFSRRSASPVRITTPVSISSGCEPGRRIGVVDDVAERGVVDALLALDRASARPATEQRLARDHVVAAGEVLAVAGAG